MRVILYICPQGGEAETKKALMLAGLDQSRPLKVADIGCGAGASTIQLAKELNGQITTLKFYLPSSCWIDNYYQPIQDGFDAFLERHKGSDQAREMMESEKAEIALYEKYRDYYSYGVYIAKKVWDRARILSFWTWSEQMYTTGMPIGFTFDIHPIPTATVSDLSRMIFESEYLPRAFARDVLEANERTYEERLASCKMIVSPFDTTPTVLGLLALGKSPQDFLAGAYVQFLRIDGTELADSVIDAEEIRGALVEALRRSEEKLKAHNRTGVDIASAPTHQTEFPYPMAAIRQILYNAVLHRTYESTNAPIRVYWFNDRIEISSPGGPYGNVTENNFGSPGITDYRNPNIADALKTFGYIQAFGRGIATARRELQPLS